MIGLRDGENSPPAVRFVPPQHIRIGEFVLMPLADGKLWIQNRDGEGMETTQAKVAIYLQGLWNAEF